MAAGLYFDIHGWAATAALGFARVGPVFFILPFLNSNVLTGVARGAIGMLVAQGLWPHAAGIELPVDMPPFPLLLLRETMIGLLLGVLLAWPFWVFHVLGSVIDNQRGATFSSSVDPATGVDTSELANLFNLFSAVIYLQGGGMALMLEMFAQSYRLCDPLSAGMPALQPVLGVAGRLIGKAVVLASPMIAALLLTEMTLGLLSRFAQQLNAFSVAMTVKSLVALIILLLYFEPVLSREVALLSIHPAALNVWLPAPS